MLAEQEELFEIKEIATTDPKIMLISVDKGYEPEEM